MIEANNNIAERCTNFKLGKTGKSAEERLTEYVDCNNIEVIGHNSDPTNIEY